MYKPPIIKERAATPIGYHKPESGLVPGSVVIKVAINGTSPPKTPLPIWYGSDMDV